MTTAGVNLKRVPRAKLPTRFGEFLIYGFESRKDGEQAIALVKGDPASSRTPLVRIHSQCFTGDTLHSLRCDCGGQLEQALQQIQEAGCGILIYQMQEGRGIGLLNKLYAYELQDGGLDTVDANVHLGFAADQRSYEFSAEILKYFQVREIRLMSNNPEKIRGLEEHDIQVAERVPLVVPSSSVSRSYLRAKKEKLGHLLE